jgi:hypothetical protein
MCREKAEYMEEGKGREIRERGVELLGLDLDWETFDWMEDIVITE